MAYLPDTNLLVRLANSNDALFVTADAAIGRLLGRGELVHSTPQNYTEFRAVATRPTGAANGLGLSAAEAEVRAAGFEADFPLLPDGPDIHPEWKRLVAATGTIGKQVHDARLAAVCSVHGVTHLLTFNTSDFVRFVPVVPGLVLVHPNQV